MRSIIYLNKEEYDKFSEKIQDIVNSFNEFRTRGKEIPLQDLIDNHFGNNRDKQEPGRITVYPIGEQG